MRFKPIELEGGQWAVSAGGGRFFTATVTDSEEEATREAAYRSAKWYLEKAAELLPELEIEEAKKLGRTAYYDIVDAVQLRLFKEADDQGEEARASYYQDPGGWLA